MRAWNHSPLHIKTKEAHSAHQTKLLGWHTLCFPPMWRVWTVCCCSHTASSTAIDPAYNNNNCKGDSGGNISFGLWGIKSRARLSFPAHIYAFCLLWWLEVGSVKVTVWNFTNCWRLHAHKHTFTNQTHQWPLNFSSLEQHRLQISSKKSWVKAITFKNCLQLKLAMIWSQILSFSSCLHSCD